MSYAPSCKGIIYMHLIVLNEINDPITLSKDTCLSNSQQ